MKAGKIDVGEFGPLGYIFAHTVADAQPVAVFADKNGKPVTYTAALWVPADSTITDGRAAEGPHRSRSRIRARPPAT